MSSMVHACLDWLRRTVRWSNSRESWQERAGFALVLAMAIAAYFYGRRLSLSSQVLLWGIVLVAVAVVLRRGWLRLFGPVLFYDLVRIARRSRYFLIRGIYGFVLLFLLGWVWFVWYMNTRHRGLRANDMADFAGSFFYTFMIVQFLVVTLLTPAYTAGAIADEKERKTLEFLLATDLRNREIVLSKLLSRLANLGLLLLVGLPVLGLLQFLGGVDPGLVVAGFAATSLTVVSLACLSILFSVLVKRTRDAIALTYLTVIGYVAVASASVLLLLAPGVASFPSFGTWQSPVTIEDLVEWTNSGNIVMACVKVFVPTSTLGTLAGPGGSETMEEVLPLVLRDYAFFHGGLSLVCAVWGVLRLRSIFLKETYGQTQKPSLGLRLLLRPRIGNFPMIWKEVFAEPRMRFHWVGRLFIILLMIASFVPAGFIIYYFVRQYFFESARSAWMTPDDMWRFFTRGMNTWVRIIGSIVATLLLLGVAVRAAGCISGERDKQTWDSLLTSPLDSTSMLFAKWLGCILSVRWGWLWLGGIAVVGTASMGLNLLALPLLLAGWFIYAAFLATLGIWFSMNSRNTLRAILWTMLSTIGVGLGHWLIWACCIPLLIVRSGPGPAFEDLTRWTWQFQLFGLTPPFTLGWLAFHGEEFKERSYSNRNEPLEYLACAIVGLGMYAGLTALFWAGANARFRQLTGRTALRRPERTGPPRPRPPRPTTRPRAPLLVSDEAADERIQPTQDGPPQPPRDAILVEEEWRDDEEKPRPR